MKEMYARQRLIATSVIQVRYLLSMKTLDIDLTLVKLHHVDSNQSLFEGVDIPLELR